MERNKSGKFLLAVFVIVVIFISVILIYDRGRPLPIPKKEQLYEGVTYDRKIYLTPRVNMVHVIVIDLRVGKVQFIVTPPDNSKGAPLNARTTSQFLAERGLQIAINGDGFYPWWSRSPLDYYPHVGDPVTPLGFTASRGVVYARGDEVDITQEPTLYINKRNSLSMGIRPGKVFNAISGDRLLVTKGEPEPDLDNSTIDPRTAIGYNRNGRKLILVVVDGRQPFYSEGMTLAELAHLMSDLGAHYAMNLDGGGSSTLVVEGQTGVPVILNSPVDNYIPGRERPVANHLGIYVGK
ncbi:MAG: phosphodiester glycosidase family protein [Anaerolineales bacterium]|nr:phosphodiester glycosidase family protein [Anaerolineales bacterium]